MHLSNNVSFYCIYSFLKDKKSNGTKILNLPMEEKNPSLFSFPDSFHIHTYQDKENDQNYLNPKVELRDE